MPGDVITGGATAPRSPARQQLQQIVAGHAAGSRLRLQVAHYGGAPTEIAVTLGGKPGAAPPAPPTTLRPQQTRPLPLLLAQSEASPARPHMYPLHRSRRACLHHRRPPGWRVSGGTWRMSAVDIRLGIEAVSPDGLITFFYGDPDVPIFTVPSDMLEMAGSHSGMIYDPGMGVRLRIDALYDRRSLRGGLGRTARCAKLQRRRRDRQQGPARPEPGHRHHLSAIRHHAPRSRPARRASPASSVRRRPAAMFSPPRNLCRTRPARSGT